MGLARQRWREETALSLTGETPQERGFCDEEARRTPHGKRPIVTEINGIVEIWTFSVASGFGVGLLRYLVVSHIGTANISMKNKIERACFD